MALTTQENKNSIGISTPTNAFSTTYKAGNHATHSSIYKCSKCSREIAFNKEDNPLPPHCSNNDCRSPE